MRLHNIKAALAVGVAVGGSTAGVNALRIPRSSSSAPGGTHPEGPSSSSSSSSSQERSKPLSRHPNLIEEYLPLMFDDVKRMDDELDRELAQMFDDFGSSIRRSSSSSSSTNEEEISRPARSSESQYPSSDCAPQQHNIRSTSSSSSLGGGGDGSSAPHKAISDVRGGGRRTEDYFRSDTSEDDEDLGGLMMEQLRDDEELEIEEEIHLKVTKRSSPPPPPPPVHFEAFKPEVGVLTNQLPAAVKKRKKKKGKDKKKQPLIVEETRRKKGKKAKAKMMKVLKAPSIGDEQRSSGRKEKKEKKAMPAAVEGLKQEKERIGVAATATTASTSTTMPITNKVRTMGWRALSWTAGASALSALGWTTSAMQIMRQGGLVNSRLPTIQSFISLSLPPILAFAHSSKSCLSPVPNDQHAPALVGLRIMSWLSIIYSAIGLIAMTQARPIASFVAFGLLPFLYATSHTLPINRYNSWERPRKRSLCHLVSGGLLWSCLTILIPLSLTSFKPSTIIESGSYKTFGQLGHFALSIATAQMAVTYFRDYQSIIDRQKPDDIPPPGPNGQVAIFGLISALSLWQAGVGAPLATINTLHALLMALFADGEAKSDVFRGIAELQGFWSAVPSLVSAVMSGVGVFEKLIGQEASSVSSASKARRREKPQQQQQHGSSSSSPTKTTGTRSKAGNGKKEGGSPLFGNNNKKGSDSSSSSSSSISSTTTSSSIPSHDDEDINTVAAEAAAAAQPKAVPTASSSERPKKRSSPSRAPDAPAARRSTTSLEIPTKKVSRGGETEERKEEEVVIGKGVEEPGAREEVFVHERDFPSILFDDEAEEDELIVALYDEEEGETM